MAGGGPKKPGDDGYERLRRQVDRQERKATQHPFQWRRGRLIENVMVPTSPTFVDVEHGLGVIPNGVHILAVRHESATATVFYPREVVDSNGTPTDRNKRTLRLYNGGSANIWVDLWVY